MTYDLVESIHGLAWEFARFAFGGGRLHPAGIHLVPDQFGMEEAIEYLFASGIAFVMLHEIGHLNQGHGSIRKKYGPGNASYLNLREFDVRAGVADPQTQGLYAAILHATELAADFEALDWMATSLLEEFRGKDLVNYAYLQCAIVSSIMLLFNGGHPMRLDAEPVGTHPYPSLRMDLWVKAYTERLRIFSAEVGAAFDAQEVFIVLSDARLLSLMSWLWRAGVQDEQEYVDLVKGFLAHPNVSEYMRGVIDAWSLVYREARSNRKYGFPLSVPYYADKYRTSIGAVPNEETLSEHVRQSLLSTRSQ